MSRAGRLAWAVGAALALTVPIAALTAWAASTPTEQLRGSVDQVLRLFDNPEMRKPARTAERREALRRVAGDIFDFAELGKRALGPHWQARTPAERDEFTRLFRELLERSYMSKIELYSGERIVYAGESVDSDMAVVRTRIVTKQGSEVPVDYRMMRRGDRWLAYDVAIEGVSLVANYRGQFNKIIQTGSYAELVKRLRAKLDERPDSAVTRVSPSSHTP